MTSTNALTSVPYRLRMAANPAMPFAGGTNAPQPDKAGIGSCFGYVTSNTTANTFNGDFSAQYCDGAVYIYES